MHQLQLRDDGRGSFTQLASLLGSGSLPNNTPLGQAWAVIPSLRDVPLTNGGVEYLPPLGLDAGFSEDRFFGWLHGVPQRFAQGYTEAEMAAYLASYPTLQGSVGINPPLPPFVNQSTQVVAVSRSWPIPGGYPPRMSERELLHQLTHPYRAENERWVFPAIGGSSEVLHPLLAWWAVLFVLSMLARYVPAEWSSYLAVDQSADAVALEAALGHARDACPQIILHTIQTATR